MIKYAAAFVCCFGTAALAQDTTVQQQMDFTTCIAGLAAPTGAIQAPVTTVDTDNVKEVTFPVADGQVTINCNASTQQATMTHK